MRSAPVEPALAVIPARGGSKRIPGKNIRLFLGEPLLARTVRLVRAANVFARIVVSTEDEEIAAIARHAGAEVPFRRPAELATDATATMPVIEHAIRTLAEAGDVSPFVCCIYPAAVLATLDDIQTGLDMLRQSGCDYVFAATSYRYPIQRALRIRFDGGCEMFWPEHRESRSQDLEPAFHDAGQFYWGTRQAWLERRPVFSPASRAVLMESYRVQDIDTLEDWTRAELIFRALHS